MSIKPILFNAEMNRAVREDRKTATRRVVKISVNDNETVLHNVCEAFYYPTVNKDGVCANFYDASGFYRGASKPPYQPGDILYVRESYLPVKYVKPRKAIPCDFKEYGYIYKADDIVNSDGTPIKWRPSIHMPKEAARTFLRVTNVRVERLQDITIEQALLEGVPDDGYYPIDPIYCPECQGEGLLGALGPNLGYTEVDCVYCNTPVKRFANLWDSTVPKHPNRFKRYLHYWEDNPWVWVIEFEKCEKPEGWPL